MNCQTLTRRSCRTRQGSILGRGMGAKNQNAIKPHGWGVVVWKQPGKNLAEPGAKGSGGDSGQNGTVPAHSREVSAAELGCGGETRNSQRHHRLSSVQKHGVVGKGSRAAWLWTPLAGSRRRNREAGELGRAGTREREGCRLAHTQARAPPPRPPPRQEVSILAIQLFKCVCVWVLP